MEYLRDSKRDTYAYFSFLLVFFFFEVMIGMYNLTVIFESNRLDNE